MELKGKYMGYQMKTSKDGRTAFAAHKILVNGKEERFTSFKMPDSLKSADGKIITVQIIQKGDYFNLDEAAEIKVEEQTQLEKVEEKKQTEEQIGDKHSLVAGVLSQTMLDAKAIFGKTFSQEEVKSIGPEKCAELICSMGMHLSNNFHR